MEKSSKERTFICKYCNKKFPSGKSLGGHIRIHTNETHNANDYSLDSDEDDHNNLIKTEDNGGGNASYSLRENPKKSKWFVDHREIMALKHHHQQQELLYCKECGKGFVSSKALCGHMACHSDREKIVMDSQSDTEGSSSPIRRRSKRVVKHHHNECGSSSIMMNQSNSASSDDSEIEPEQEEMALSLMMMSRDSSFKKGHHGLVLNSVAESSDNNSVILETKSSSGEQIKKIFEVKNVVDEFCKKDKLVGVDHTGENNGDVMYVSDNSDSGYFRNGPKKLDSDVSVDGFLRNTQNKDVMRYESTAKHGKNLNRWSGSGSGFGSGRSSTKYDLRKSKRGITCYGRKKTKYDELTESVYDSGEHSLETESCTVKTHHSKPPMVKKASGGTNKKSKGHECPICFRVFKSGQALGGHKRSHFIGNQEHRTLVIRQHHHHQVPHEIHTLIDLNLPAPIDE
ncbi:unnamed protein product [Cochlearia groenlandica]